MSTHGTHTPATPATPATPIYIGWDPHEMMAWNIAQASLQEHAFRYHDVRRLALSELRMSNLYTRPVEYRDGRLYDPISEAPMSTEHAIARFFVPMLRNYQGWAVFLDGDVLVRSAIDELLALAEDQYAVMVVKHPAMSIVSEPTIKKDGAPQQFYSRKNWSSVMLFNCAHPANQSLTLDTLNLLPGRDLHRFCWLADYEIGELPPTWNWLAGVSEPLIEPALVHFTLGTPNLPYARASAYDSEWTDYARRCGYRGVVAATGAIQGEML